MISEITIEEALSEAVPIIDVRSPGEFEKGHIPEANHIPLFSNDERAHIGTVYKQRSKEEAIVIGYEYVKPKLKKFINNALQLAPKRQVIIHCWRGGMRSRSFAKHLSDNGFTDVKVIVGGYKSYRNYVLNSLALPIQLNVLGGYTGSGKTQVLRQLKSHGNQVIDLEKLANHRGSAFGGIGKGKQPTVEQFENNLLGELKKLDSKKIIWVEDESYNIGRVKIPIQFFEQMRNACLFFVEIPKEERAKYLVTEYAGCNKQLLADSIRRISKRLGDLNTKNAIKHLEKDNFYEVALLSLQYYDKFYLKGMKKRKSTRVIQIPILGVDPLKNALKIEKLTTECKT
jgi:tRNA 2-selenouridine synthase